MGTVMPVSKLKTTWGIFVEKFPPRANLKNLKSKNPNISKRNSSSALLKSNKTITTQSPKNISSIMSTKRKIEDEETEATKKAKPTYDDEEEEEDEVEAEGEEEEGEEDEDEDGVGGVDGEDEDGEEEEDLEGEEDEEGGEEEEDDE